MQIKKQEENKLLERIEVEAEIAFSGATPSRAEIRKQLASQLKSDESLVIVKKIDTKFGEGVASIQANVYKKSKELEGNEPKYVMKRHEKEAKKAEAPAAPAAEAVPVAEGEEAASEAPVEEAPATEPAKEEAPTKEAEEVSDKPAEKVEASTEEPVAKEKKKE